MANHDATWALAAVMSGSVDTGMTVVTGHRQAGYDPETDTMYLPHFIGMELPDEAREKILALVGHEAGERGVSEWMPNDPRWVNRPQLKSTVNALCDLNVNRQQSLQYRGFRHCMNGVNARHVDTIQWAETPSHAGKALYFLGEGTVDLDWIEATFPEKHHLITPFAERVKNAKSEADCLAVALELYDRFVEDMKDPQQDEEEPQQGGGSEGQETDDSGDEPECSGGSGSGESEEKNEEEQDEQSEESGGGGDDDSESSEDSGEEQEQGAVGSQEDGEDDEATPQPGDDGSEEDESGTDSDGGDEDEGEAEDGDQHDDEEHRAEGQGDDEEESDSSSEVAPPNVTDDQRDEAEQEWGNDKQNAAPQDVGAALIEQVNDHFETNRVHKGVYTFETQYDEIRHAGGERKSLQGDEALAAATLYKIIRRTLRGLEFRKRPLHRRGHVDPSRVAHLAAGLSDRVFQKREMLLDDGVAVALSADLSGSIKDHLHLIRFLARAWGGALEKATLPYGIFGWTTDFYAQWDVSYGPGTYRREPLRNVIFKDFHEPFRGFNTKQHSIGALGCTPTAEGLLFGWQKLLRQPAHQRVMVMITDGQPYFAAKTRVANDQQPHIDFLTEVVEKIRASGVAIIPMGVGDMKPPERAVFENLFGDDWMYIRRAEDLYGSATQTLTRLIRASLDKKEV